MQMHKLVITGCMVAVVASATISVYGNVICSGESAAVRVNTSLPSTVNKALTIYASPWAGKDESVTVAIDGTCVFSTTNQAETAWRWQPLTKGNHTLTCTFGTNVLTKTLNVTALDFFVQPFRDELLLYICNKTLAVLLLHRRGEDVFFFCHRLQR